MIENGWESNRAEKYGVKPGQLFNTVRRHHRTGFQVTLTGPVEIFKVERDIKARGYRFENFDPLGNHFLANTIPRDNRNTVIRGHF